MSCFGSDLRYINNVECIADIDLESVDDTEFGEWSTVKETVKSVVGADS